MAKGIIIDVGFKADIKNFIGDIEKDLKKIDFDDIIGLSDSFDKQVKNVKSQLSKLKEEIDKNINVNKTGDPSKQLEILNKAVGVLASSLKDLGKNIPGIDSGVLSQLDKVIGDVGQLSDMCGNATDAVKDLKNITKGEIRFVDSSQKKELESMFKLLERAREESESLGTTKKQHGNKAYEDSNDALRDLVYSYQIYAETMKKIRELESNTSLSDSEKTNEMDKLNASLVYSITNLDRMITTYSQLDKKWKELSIFKNSKTTLESLQYNIKEPLQEALNYISKRKVEIQQAYSEIGGGDLQKLFEKGIKNKTFEIPIPLSISTRSSTLYREAISIIESVQSKLNGNPLEVQVILVSDTKYKTKKNSEILEQIAGDLDNITDEEIKGKLTNLINNLNSQFKNNLHINIEVEGSKEVQEEVENLLTNLKKTLEDAVKIYPEIILSEEAKTKLQSDINALSEGITVNIGIKDEAGEAAGVSTTKEELKNVTKLRRCLESIIKSIEDKTAAFQIEEQTVSGVVSREITSLQELDGWILEIKDTIDSVSNLIINMPNFKIDFDEKSLKKLKELRNNGLFDELFDNKKLGEISILEGIPEDQKEKLLKDVQELSRQVDTIFETGSIDNWTSKFLSSLTEISNKIKTLFGNNALSDMIEQWISSDEIMINRYGKSHLRERAAVIDDKGNVYGSGTYDKEGSTVFVYDIVQDLKKKGITSKIGIHSHGADRIVASSIPQGNNTVADDADLGSNYWEYIHEGLEKQLTIALNDIEVFDAKGFYDSNSSIKFDDDRIKNLIRDKKNEIQEETKKYFYQYFEQFISQYGSGDGLNLKDEIFNNITAYGSQTKALKNEIYKSIDPQILLENFFKETKTSSTNNIRNILLRALTKSIDISNIDYESIGYSKDGFKFEFKGFLDEIIYNAKRILDDTFDISNFDYDTKTGYRDLSTFNFRQITPRILKEALAGEGYKNNYQDFMKTYSKEDFIKQNPLGLSSGSLSDLFDTSSSTAFLETLDKIVADLNEIKNFSSSDAIASAFNIKIDEGSLKTFIEEINKLIETLEKLPSLLTKSFSDLKISPDSSVDSIDRRIQELNVELEETSNKIKEIEQQLSQSSNVGEQTKNNFDGFDGIIKQAKEATDESEKLEESLKRISLYKNITAWNNINKKFLESGQKGLRENTMAGNIFTGYSTRPRQGKVAGTQSSLINNIIDSATEEINTYIHSHPTEPTAAFSFDDIERASELLCKNITYQIATSLNDISMLDVSGFTEEDLLKISDKMKEMAMCYVPEAKDYLVDDEKAYPYEFSRNFNENIQYLFDNIISELKATNESINLSEFRTELESQLSSKGLNLGSYDDLYESLKDLYMRVAESFNVDDKIFKNAWENIDTKILADFQESMLKEAVNGLSSSEQLSTKVNFDDIYKKFSFDDFGKYLLSNITNTLNKSAKQSVGMSGDIDSSGTDDTNALTQQLKILKDKQELLIKQIELLKEQKALLNGTGTGGISNKTEEFKTEGSIVDSVISGEIKSLEALENKLSQVTKAVKNKTNAFKEEGRVVNEVIGGEVKDLDPLKNLELSYNNFKKFYDNNDLESEAGAEAALSYYNAYKEALASKVNKKDLQKYTIGKTEDLFTGNYTNYKKGIGDLDLSGLNSEIAKYQEIIDKLNQPEAISIINSLTEAIEKLLNAGTGSEQTTKLLENLNKVINNLGNSKGADKIARISENLENFQKSIQILDISDNGFIQSLNSILEKGEELKALGEVLKSTQKQINAAGKAVKAEENLSKAQEYLGKYENDIREAVNKDRTGKNETVLYQQLQATKDGLVQIVALIKDANDEYKKFIYTTTDGSDLKIKATTYDDDPAVAKLKKQYEAYKRLQELTIPGAKNLGKEDETFTPDSDGWDQLIDKAKEFGIEAENIVKIIRNVDELDHESFQIFTELSRVTVGMDSKGVLFQRDNVFDKSIINDFKKEILSLRNLLKNAFSGDDLNTKVFLDALDSISNKWKELSHLNENNPELIDDKALQNLQDYFNIFKTIISSISLDKISTDNRPEKFILQLKDAEDQLDLVKIALDKVESGEVITDEDIDNIKLFISQVRELQNLAKDKSNKSANPESVGKYLKKIYKDLENTAMSSDLKKRFQELAAEMEAFGKKMPLDKFQEFKQRFQDLDTEMHKTGQTGLSFFDGIIKRAKSMSQSFISMYLSLWDIIRYVRTGMTYIKELDTAFTEMRKVSDETTSSLEKFQKVSFDIANSVGTTALQIQNSTADWMRLGESLDEASKSAETSNILLNVSEFESIDEATESLVAMSAAYDDLDKIDIVDKLNQVGNNFAISTDGLATALQRSASALKTAGNDMDEAVALVTAGNQVVQNPDSVGAGLRTISLRITGTEEAKAELEELGEDTSDFIVQTASKTQAAIKNFTKVASNDFKGFDILDENGNYKSTYDILLGISEIYEEIVETDKKYGSNMANGLLETLAGKNRANIAASILQSPDVLKAAYEDSAYNSEGSAQQELSKYLDSIEGRLQQFNNEVQKFWYNLISSDTIKTFISAGTKIIDFIGKITDKVGLLGTAIGGVVAVVSFKSMKNGGGRAKMFALRIVKYATESFSREVCEFWCILE